MRDITKIPLRYKRKNREKEKDLEILLHTGNNRLMYTSKNIVEGMVNLLPKEVWSNSKAKLLDLYCKSGRFLDTVFWKLFDNLNDEIPNELDRTDHILTNQLLG